MKRGKFISFEGGEGRGKSTQAQELATALRRTGLTVDVTREPGGTPGSEAIRTLLLDPPGEGWTIAAEALLFAAARSDHVAKRIEPALEQGHWVISDRFLDSSRAYQGVAGRMGDDAIRMLHGIGSADLLPDLTILLETEEETAAGRLRDRDGGQADAIGGRDAAYHAKVASAFREFATREPGRFEIISSEGTIPQVHDRVWQSILPLLDEDRR